MPARLSTSRSRSPCSPPGPQRNLVAAGDARSCAPARDPQVGFPFSEPSRRSGRGAILWLGSPPGCALAGAVTLNAATLHTSDRPGVARSALEGRAERTAGRGRHDRRPARRRARRRRRLDPRRGAGRRPPSPHRNDRRAGHRARGCRRLHRRRRTSSRYTRSTAARRSKPRAQRHDDRAFAPAVNARRRGADHLAGGRARLPRRLARDLGAERRGARAMGSTPVA